ncbi:Pyridoxamine 5'-phosphate oxidase [Nocardioides sp. YR527]|uniref:pyridoxamine 5'-phosphate oxidase family protein n=1 Tax=Nocardioides sp. YR527 TaxID=1881028 RepID=UPI000891D82E|nr:pyridoxamine 5'-phosphate oxidase family protein [Nocardioides sp. YR527]SDJ71664.1 Pyridoxamine 5'-phosphate oxidase [Nocardioides sp. YR527]
MGISLDDRQEFLTQPLIAALSVARQNGRAPLTVPIWYDYTPGGDAWIVTGKDSLKTRLIREAGRCTLMVERLEPTVRYVSIEGPVQIADAAEGEAEAMARRYLPPQAAEAYLAQAASFPPEVTIRLTPEHWISADLGAL